MEIGLREWLIIVGAAFIVLIVIDGWRRMVGARNQLRMDIEKQPDDVSEEVVGEYNPELPNGGARKVVSDGSLPASVAVASSEAVSTVAESAVESTVAETAVQESPEVETAVADAATVVVPETEVEPVAVEPTVEMVAEPAVVAAPVIESTELASAASQTGDRAERVEPTFSLDAFSDVSTETTDNVLTSEEPVVSKAETAAANIQLETIQPEPAAERFEMPVVEQENSAPVAAEDTRHEADAVSGDAVVVEEEIMTSAALFEAIELSRRQRVAEMLEQEELSVSATEEVSTPDYAAAQAPESLAESAAIVGDKVQIDVEPVIAGIEPSQDDAAAEPVAAPRPDPLLRPMEIEAELLSAQPQTDAIESPITHESAARSDDPLMEGFDAAEFDLPADEAPLTADSTDEPLAIELPMAAEVAAHRVEEPELAVQPEASAVVVAPEITMPEVAEFATEVEEAPRFIAEIAAEQPAAQADAHLPTIDELELPEEFTPQTRKQADVVTLSEAPVVRADTVVAFPEKTREPEPEKALETQQESTDEVAQVEAPVKDDRTVQGGSLSHQPDPENVLVMTVVSQDPNGFDGASLLQLVLACGMRFGEMDIFHRFEDGIDTGAVQFSVANATGAGVFDINNMEAIHTRAVSFFMSMEEPREVMNAFECMLATAETVARHLNGELVDDSRLLMRPQTQEHYRQRVRDFEMRNLRRRSG